MSGANRLSRRPQRLGAERHVTRPIKILFAALVWAVMAAGSAFSTAAEPSAARVEAARSMVVSVSPQATDAGLATLRAGGNAVDAAVATALALAVTFPEAGNIGGGGFMMVWPGDGTPPQCVDYRETAPAKATADMFAHDRMPYSLRAVGVPGTVRGLELAHRRWGKLPWAQLVAPAMRLAADGFPIDAALAEDLSLVTAEPESPAEFRHAFTRADGAQWRPGATFVQPDLAKTLRALADGGGDAFYQGEIAAAIVRQMEADDGLVTAQDLAGYQARLRPALHGTYRGFDIYGVPPPSSGGTCIIQMLNILENFDLASAGRGSPRTVHLMIESMRRSYCDRARYLGDPDFVEIPPHLTSKDYARKLAAGIDPQHATTSVELAPELRISDEGESTTHFSIVDVQGMAVANTYTLQESYGARIVVRGGGFLLNNEMTDFNARPGHTDRQGAIGTPANVIAPGKRMLSSQSPTLVARDGRLRLITGTPGGRTIPNTVLCVLINVLDFDQDIRAAVDAPRLHHQWLPDVAILERATAVDQAPLVRQLETWGHRARISTRAIGDAHSIELRDGKLIGAADWRQAQGKAAGE